MPLTNEEIRECTMLALSQIPRHFDEAFNIFKFTIDTRLGRVQTVNGLPQSLYDPDLADYQINKIYLDGIVAWGDGTSDLIDHTYADYPTPMSVSHTYSEAGVYQITVIGNLETIVLGQASVSQVAYAFDVVSIDTPLPASMAAVIYSTNAYQFSYCANLMAIPSDLYQMVGVAYLYHAFYRCYSLTSIPSGLFDGVVIYSPTYAFYGCSGITELQGDVFSGATLESPNFDAFAYAFCYTGITRIGEGLFAPFRNGSNACFSYCFASTPLSSIPADLFVGLGADGGWTQFDFTFYNCTELTEIPATLFSDAFRVETVRGCFRGCSAIVSIPDDLFNNFEPIYFGCDFRECFAQCGAIASVPAQLFDCVKGSPPAPPPGEEPPNVMVRFDSCFSRCTSLATVPSQLFDGVYGQTSFASCFASCAGLADVPNDVFGDSLDVVDPGFGYTFQDCAGITSRVPELWVDYPSASHIRCYRNCNQASNYADIPADWK